MDHFSCAPVPEPGVERAHLALSGTALGDIAGSTHEGKFEKAIPKELIGAYSHYTDETVLSCAVAEGMRAGVEKVGRAGLAASQQNQSLVKKELALALRNYARQYPYAGYGKRFWDWASSGSLEAYNSYGNGAAMRAAFPGWYATTMAEAQLLGQLSAAATHDNPVAIEATGVVAGCIYLLKTGGSKRDVLKFAQKHYDLSFTLDALRPMHGLHATCPGSVMVAIVSFLESTSFRHALGLAISMGGDCDTQAAITGAIAEAYYTVEPELLVAGLARLDNRLLDAMTAATCILEAEGLWHPGTHESAEPLTCRCRW